MSNRAASALLRNEVAAVASSSRLLPSSAAPSAFSRRRTPPSRDQRRTASSSSSSPSSASASTSKSKYTNDTQDTPSSSSSSSPTIPHRLYEGSRAFERQRPSPVRFFGRRTLRPSPTLESSSGNGKSSLLPRLDPHERHSLTTHEPDTHLRFLYSKLRRAADASRVSECLDLCAALAHHLVKLNRPITALPFHCILKAMVNSADIEGAKKVVEDMRECGVEVGLTTLNLLLVVAVRAREGEEVMGVLRRIRELPVRSEEGRNAEDGAQSSTSSTSSHAGPSAGPAIAYSPSTGALLTPIRNYDATTYGILFNHYRKTKDLESALLLLSALSRPTPSLSTRDAVSTLLLPKTAQKILALCLDVRELGLALDLAVWLADEVGGGERLVSNREWMEIAAESAHRGFLPGLRTSLRRAMSSLPYAPDSGFILSALNTASTHGDVPFCHEILGLYLAALPSSPTHPEAQLQHLHRAHLDALVDAYAHAGRFEEAVRLIAAIRGLWGLSGVDEVAAASLEFRAARDRESLSEAGEAWRRALSLERGAAAATTASTASPSSSAAGPSYPISPRTAAANLAENNVIALAATGRLPYLSPSDQPHGDIVALNALLRSAAKLGEADIALRLWEDAKRYNAERARQQGKQKEGQSGVKGATLIEPTIETFNALLWACQTRIPTPSLRLALSVYKELLEWTEEAAKRAAAAAKGEGEGEQSTASASTPSKRSRRTSSSSSTAAGTPPRLRPNALTYEHLISICVHPSTASTATALRHNIDAAFAWLEEAKGRRLKPTRASYERLVRAVRDEDASETSIASESGRRGGERGDGGGVGKGKKARWEQVLEEMEGEAGYEVGATLREFLRRRERREEWVGGR